MRIHEFLNSALATLLELRAERLPPVEDRVKCAAELRQGIAENESALLDFAEQHLGTMPTSEYYCPARAAGPIVGSALLNLCPEVCEGCRLQAIADIRDLLAAGPASLPSPLGVADAPQPVTWKRVGDEVRVGRPGSVVALAGQEARLFCCVAGQTPQSVAWREVLTSWAKEDPRPRTNEQTIERLGRRVRESLGELGFHWHQDREGARWIPPP